MSENYSEDIAKELYDEARGILRPMLTKKERGKLAAVQNNKTWNKVLRRREKEIKQKGVTLTQQQYDDLCKQARTGVTAEARVMELEGQVTKLEKTNDRLNIRLMHSPWLKRGDSRFIDHCFFDETKKSYTVSTSV